MKSKNIIKAIAIGSLLAMGTTMLPNLNFNVEIADAAEENIACWEPANINVSKAQRDIAYGNNVYVTVGYQSGAYSTDGKDWSYSTGLDTTEDYNKLCYGNGKFITISKKGEVFYSLDGKSWSKSGKLPNWYYGSEGSNDGPMNDIIYENNIFVAIMDRGKYYYSKDGETWIQAVTPSSIATPSDNICYAGGKFYTVGYARSYIFCSEDGANWEQIETPSDIDEIQSMAYGNGKFIGVGLKQCMTSTDGVHWEKINNKLSNSYYYSIIYANNMFLTDYYYSLDGETWKSTAFKGVSMSDMKNIRYINNMFWGADGNGIKYLMKISSSPTLSLSNLEPTKNDINIKYEADNQKYTSVKLPNGEISNTVSGEYEISKNGTYDFVFTKSDGTEETKSIEVTNIDKVAPTMTIEKTKSSDGTKYSVRVNSPDTDISSIRLADGTQVNNPSMPYNFNITKNGSYRITLKDKAGNVTSERISITDLVTTASNKSEAQEKIDKITDKSYTSDISDAIDSVSRLPEGSDKDSAIRDLLDKIKSYLENSSNEDKLDSVSALIDRTQNNQVTNIDNNLSIPRKSTISAIKTISNKEEKKAMIDELAKSTNDLSGTFIDGGNKLQLSASGTILNIGDNLNLSSITQLNYNGVDLSQEQINSLELVPEDSSFFEGTKAIKEGTTKVRVKLSSEESVSPMKARTRFLRASSLKLMAAANDISTFEETVNPAISEPIDIKIIQPASLSADTTTPSKTVDITCNGSSDVYPSVTCPDGSSINVGQSYTVSENGTYSFEFLKSDGNTETKTITISNIDKDKPTLTVNPNTEEETKDNVILSVSADDENFDYIELPNGEKVTEKTATYEVSENGSYTFKAVDKVGNETIKEVNVTNINKITPPAPIPSEGNTSISTEGKTDNGVNVTFNQKDSIQLTLSTNKIDFGDVTGLTHSDSHNPEDLVANVKSSLSYDLDVKANDNFKKSDENDLSVPISKLGVKVDANDYTKFTEVNTPINLVSNAPATYTVGDDGQNYTLKFDLDSTIGYKAGTYEAPLTITATQK